MDYKIEVFKVSHRKIFYLFICLNTIALGCMIATLFIPSWSSFRSNNADLSRDFKGKLLETSEISKESNYVNFIDLFYLCPHKTCKFWKSLYIGGSSYAIFECLSIGCTIIWTGILVFFLRKKDYLVGSLFFCAMAWMGHFIAIVTWLSVIKATYNGDCHNSRDVDITICAEDAPKLSLAILLLITIVNIAYLIIARKIIIQKLSFEEQRYATIETETEAKMINKTTENDSDFIMRDEICTEQYKASSFLNETQN
ncbi:unnamed protein product [Blepharisma stoltei]|uniref:Uncharacterized protein n=1 Tax=Blepharisma stoltei TaxID=1481888 RepID=A0AAU9IE50_9CILI|nr:unnamed protein product [Blepharisma stoltei]